MQAGDYSKIPLRVVKLSEKKDYFADLQGMGWEQVGQPIEFRSGEDFKVLRLSSKKYCQKLGANMVAEVTDPSFSDNSHNNFVFYIWKRGEHADPTAQPPQPPSQKHLEVAAAPAQTSQPAQQQQAVAATYSAQQTTAAPQQQAAYNPQTQQQAAYNPQAQQQAAYNPQAQQQAAYNPQAQQQAAYNPQAQQQTAYNPQGQSAGYNPQAQQQAPAVQNGQAQIKKQIIKEFTCPHCQKKFQQYVKEGMNVLVCRHCSGKSQINQPAFEGSTGETVSLRLKGTYQDDVEALDDSLDILVKMLALDEHPIKFVDTGEFIYPQATIKKNAYSHLGNRMMNLILLKEAVNDYKIIGNEVHGTAINPRRDELFHLKTLGQSYLKEGDWNLMDPQQVQMITRAIYVYVDYMVKKMGV